MKSKEQRVQEAETAMKLERILGAGYKIEYDSCESCFTRCYYKGIFYKEVPNEEMRPNLNVAEYTVPVHIYYSAEIIERHNA